MITNEMRNSFDKFYTKPEIAKHCFNRLMSVLNFVSLDSMFFVEPSAGSGRLLDVISSKNKIGFDLFPERDDIIQADFLQTKLKNIIPDNLVGVAFSNVPFGKKSELAIKFVNKLLRECSYVSSILPVEFNKYSVQNKINKNAKLIYSETLPQNSFTFGEKDKDVNCCFQIWTTKKTKYKNLRIVDTPKTSTDDFEMYQYNCTETAKKYFTYSWNFAVLRQGYNSEEFSKKYYSLEELKAVKNYSKKQWIFFNTTSKEILEKLLKIDFKKLSEKNTTSAKGFGKADVIEEYNKISPRKTKKSITKFMKG